MVLSTIRTGGPKTITPPAWAALLLTTLVRWISICPSGEPSMPPPLPPESLLETSLSISLTRVELSESIPPPSPSASVLLE